MNKFVAIFFVALSFVGCELHTPEFYYTQNDLKYQYHDIAQDGKTPLVGDYLTVIMQYKTKTDSVFFDSKISAFNGQELIILGKPTVEGGIEEGFAQLMEGDSVTFYIAAQKFYANYLKKDIPKFLKAEEEIKITLRLLKVERPKEYKARIKEEKAIAELNEFIVLNEVLDEWKQTGDSIYDFKGIFMIFDDTTFTNEISYGDLIKVKYKGYFPDGRVFYDNTNDATPDEFQAGIKGQNIEGMKMAIMRMKYGQKAKVLVPSFLGFNESVIEQGLVPQFTPVIFEIEIINEPPPKKDTVEATTTIAPQ